MKWKYYLQAAENEVALEKSTKTLCDIGEKTYKSRSETLMYKL